MEKSRKKKKYTQISIEDKLKILQRLEAGEKNKALAADYGVSHSAITYIARQKNNIQAHSKLLDNQQGNPKKTRMDAVEDSALEKATFEWFCQKRSLGEPVPGNVLQEKALELNKQLDGSKNFTASSGWVKRFKQRHGIRELSIQGESLSTDVGESEKFKRTFDKFLRYGGYNLDNVYNADETGLAWKSLPRRALAGIEETTAAGRKILDDRVTVMTCANATGSHRMKPLVIGKSEGSRCLQNAVNLPVTYRSQQSAWMDRSIFEEWYRTEFIPSVTQRKSGANERFLLLLDNAPSHSSLEVLNAIDSRCTVIYSPPNVTAQIQPMNQGIIEIMKMHYRKVFLRNLLLEASTGSAGIVDFLRKWTMFNCCLTIAEAWDALTESTLAHGWRMLLRDYSTPFIAEPADDLTRLLNLMESQGHPYSVDETEEWLRIDESCSAWEEVDKQIVAIACSEESPEFVKLENKENEDSDDDSPIQDMPAPLEVLSAMDILSRWYVGRWIAQPEDFRSLYKMRNDAISTALEDNAKFYPTHQ